MKRKGFWMHYLIKGTSTNQEVYSWGKVTGPTCPSGAFRTPDQRGAPFLQRETRVGGKLATQVRAFANSGVVSSMGYSKETRRMEPRSVEPARKSAQGLEEVCAQSIEFVAVAAECRGGRAAAAGGRQRAMRDRLRICG